MKYINADKLIAEVERRKEKWLAESRLIRKGKDKAMYAAGKSSGYTEFLSLIDSLQQEQAEVQNGKFVFPKHLYARTKDNKTIDMSYAPQDMTAIEYIRNDSLQQEQPQVADASNLEQPVEGMEELRKEVIKFSQDHFDELHSDMETIDIVHIIACHFAEWGAAHARKEK